MLVRCPRFYLGLRLVLTHVGNTLVLGVVVKVERVGFTTIGPDEMIEMVEVTFYPFDFKTKQ